MPNKTEVSKKKSAQNNRNSERKPKLSLERTKNYADTFDFKRPRLEAGVEYASPQVVLYALVLAKASE